MDTSLSRAKRDRLSDRTRKSMTPFSTKARLSLCLLLCATAGCSFAPRYSVPNPTVNQEPLPASYKEKPSKSKDGGNWRVANPSDSLKRGAWWTIYNDPELNRLEDQLNVNNQNIKQSYENFLQARALASETAAQLYPTLTLNGSYTRSRAAQALPATSIMTALDVSWEPDIWGKVRNALKAAEYNAQLSAADLENLRLSEQASLAQIFFQLRGQDLLQRLYNETIIQDKKALEYNKAQFETGITDQISVVEATNTLQNAQATAVNIGVARAQFEHAIAVLLGKVASNFSIPVKALDRTPPAVPVGLPSELVERRPDVAAAERAIAAANAQIGMAYAAYFPAVTFGADRGFQSNKFSRLLDTHNSIWSVGPSVSETIYDAGLRSATVKQYIATYNAALAGYRQTVLTAFQQVEDGLAQTRIYSKQLVLQKQAAESAQTFVKLEMARYQTGIDPYLDVVTAQNTLLADQQAVINVQVLGMTSSVQLIKALGGGWDRSQLPTPHQVGKPATKAESTIQQ